MESLTALLSSLPVKQYHSKAHNNISTSMSALPYLLQNSLCVPNSASRATHFSARLKTNDPIYKRALTNHHLSLKIASLVKFSLNLPLSFALMAEGFAPSACFAAEMAVSNEQVSDKINLESILVSIDDFFNRNPFFVAGVTFIWLVVIPLTEEYLRKYKFVSAIDAFRKLRDNPNSQLLDIRDKRSLLYLSTPNLKILNKQAVQINFVEGEEDNFVKKVSQIFKDPGNTTICTIDNFDGNSLKVAELLFKNGFKEAYAIKGGLRGKDGWQAIQETLLPPSVHVFPKKNGMKSKQQEVNRKELSKDSKDNDQSPSSVSISGTEETEKGYIGVSGSAHQPNLSSKRPLSPYPNYPDMRPPSSPTPSKPQN